MYVLVIEFDRIRGGQSHREKRFWTFARRSDAEREAERFAHLVQAGSTQFLRGGDKLSFQESRLYAVDTEDRRIAEQNASQGDAELLQHAFNPALDSSTYWEELLEQLEVEETKSVSARLG